MMNFKKYKKRICDMWTFHTSVGNKVVLEDSGKLLKYYSADAPLPKQQARKTQIVFMVDGRTESGGLCDRFRGLISTYYWAINHGFDFRVHYVCPFRLEDYLLPSKYDWRLADEDISYNSGYSKPIHVHYESNNFLRQFLFRMLRKNTRGRNFAQYHVYTNILAVNQQYFCRAFHELFRPVPILEEALNGHIAKIGQQYAATSFRFMQLLGDFKDCVTTVLSDSEKVDMIEKCLAQLKQLYEECGLKKILVASDSETFAKRAAELDFVYTIPGKIVHIDYCSDNNYDLHLKTFLDFFMISNAEKAFLLVTGEMYPKSAFAQFASWIGEKPFEIIKF